VMLPLTAAGLRAIQDGETWVESAQVEGEWLLIYSAPLVRDGQITGAVQVAHALATQDAYMGALERNLLLASGVAIVVAFGCGWLLSGLVLRPIHRITHTARTIGADRDLSRRVEYRGPNDELGQLATTLNTMLGELETAHQQQQQFVADVSHELRTPLTTLNGNIELLRRQPPISDLDRAEVLADMAEESKRLIRLVTALLTLARADARQPQRCEVIQLEPLLRELMRQVTLLAPGRVVATRDLGAGGVVGDPDALRQVLLILIDNALKYTDGPIDLTAVASGDASVEIRVSDGGPGIDSAILPHVFERFYRADTVHGSPGFGLGLAIAKELVEAQGGRIALESDAERGSIVTLTLPRAGA
jgi:two-component system, OmpR family, sensor kinase